MKVYLFLTFVLFVSANFAFGQEASSAELKKTEMKKLDKMAGQWKGSGWIQQGPTKETFTGSENVQKKVDGLAVLVEGKFSNPAGKVIHETLGVLSYDDALKNNRFATYLANGITGVQDFKVVGDHYEWGFQIPNVGRVRYTIKIDNDTWSEIGEFSRDGKTWFKNFEMKLDRVK